MWVEPARTSFGVCAQVPLFISDDARNCWHMFRGCCVLLCSPVSVCACAPSPCEWARQMANSIRESELKGMCGDECRGAFVSKLIVQSQTLPPLSTSISISLSSFPSHSHTSSCSLLIALVVLDSEELPPLLSFSLQLLILPVRRDVRSSQGRLNEAALSHSASLYCWFMSSAFHHECLALNGLQAVLMWGGNYEARRHFMTLICDTARGSEGDTFC